MSSEIDRRMTRRGFCAAGVVAAGLGGRLLGREKVVPNPVKLGLIGSLFREIPAGLVLFAMQPFKDYLDGELGVQSKLIASGDPFEVARDLRDGKIHVAVYHGTELAWAQERYPQVKPLFIAVNGDPVLTAHLIVRKASPYRTVADLKDRSLAIPARTREHCWMFLERRCVKPGMKPSRFYASLRRTFTPDETLNQVAAGHTPAALIDGGDWAAYQAENPARADKLRPLLSSEPLPCALVACWDGLLDDGLIAKFRNGMLTAARSEKGRELLKVMRVTGFQPVPENFDKQLAAAAKAYPPQK
ncbi:MAG: phosphate/phosphite/phosphonate ABC transporter substrate-binding protein [Gemmataceae bacterium]